MRQRCLYPTSSTYKRYGARGITICDRWMSFDNFFADMGPRPTPKHSIDRIDNDGPYSPDNCRWATTLEQQANRRSNVMLTHDGETLCAREWDRRLGLTKGQVLSRIRKGMSVEDALTRTSIPHSFRRGRSNFGKHT